VLTQFLSQSLLQHLSEGWQFGGLLKNHFIINVPASRAEKGAAYITGAAGSDCPVTPGAFQTFWWGAFVAKISQGTRKNPKER
jgi:hypothetical protein